MKTLDIKPLSVNDAWKGRRFKSDRYKKFQNDVCRLLGPMEIPEGEIVLHLEWGFSSRGSDVDNPIKPFTDCLQNKYGFNDNRIVEMHVKKVKVKKGQEYIKFSIVEQSQ